MAQGRDTKMTEPRLPTIPFAKGGVNPCLANGCSACCHDIEMLLTEADVARIALDRPEVDFAFRADDGYLQLHTRDGPAAAGGAGRPCIFLHASGSCSIHDIRPEGCRLYPAFWADEARRSELDDVYCPHTTGFILPQATQDAVRRLAERLRLERDARVARAATANEKGPSRAGETA